MKQINELIKKMGIRSKVINFDNAALSYMPEPVLSAISQYNQQRNTMGPEYAAYWETTEEARSLIAKKIGVQAKEIFFIQNTSMGLNFVAKALGLKTGDNVIVSDMEFPSNIYPWLNLEREGVEVRIVRTVNGKILPEEIKKHIDAHTRAVSVSWVIAANGSVTDIETMGEICRNKKITYIIDGIQGLGQIPISLKEIHCDFFISGFFKWMMGPDGIGFVYIKQEILDQLEYPWLGWAGMKDKFNYSEFKVDVFDGAKRYETGNMNFSALCGLVSCLKFTDGWEESIRHRICELSGYLRDKLDETDGVNILSDRTTLSGITLFTSDHIEELSKDLKTAGYKFSTRGGIRVSVHFYNCFEEIEEFIRIVKNVRRKII